MPNCLKNITEGVAGFFVGGSSGECFLLSIEERMQLFELAAKYKGNKKITANVGVISTDEAIAYGQEAKWLGVDGIAAIAPFYFRFSPAAVADY